ncbi:hypothetical protein ACQP1W_33560 [Spirillospora sp. CA-255316]
MRPMTLWRYEARRAGWTALLGPPIAVTLGVSAALANPQPGDTTTARILLGTLEMAVPLAAGVGCASLVGRDPAVELQLAVPTPYRVTLLRRTAVTLGWAAVVAGLTAAVLIATGWWARWPANHGPFAGQLTWAAPTVALGAVGLAAGAVFRSPAAAGALVTTLWTLQQFFADLAQQHLPGRLLYLFATTRGAVPGDWTRNRLALLGAAATLLALALVVLARSERLIGQEEE